MRVLVGVVLAFLFVPRLAAAAPADTCVEHRCYCDGDTAPATVVPCGTTCTQACGGSASDGLAPLFRRVAIKLSVSTLAGPAYTARDAGGGTTAPGGGAFGGALELRFGLRAVGLLVRTALTSTRVVSGPVSAASGPGSVQLAPERALVFERPGLGIEVSPRVARGPGWELRPTAAVWLSWLTLRACSGCADFQSLGLTGGYGHTGWAARAGVDLYLGARARHGLSLAAVYSHAQVGDLHEGTGTEHVAPSWMLSLGFTTLVGR